MINEKQLRMLMKKMNMKQEEIEAKRVVIELEDKNIIIEEPSVVKLEISGRGSYQIAGKERIEEKLNEEDIKLIMEKGNVSKEKAIELLKKAEGKVADALMMLEQENQNEG